VDQKNLSHHFRRWYIGLVLCNSVGALFAYALLNVGREHDQFSLRQNGQQFLPGVVSQDQIQREFWQNNDQAA
jgi:hypothetical protein